MLTAFGKHFLIQLVYCDIAVLGGGEVLTVSNPLLNVGQRNVLLAEDMLKKMKLNVFSSDVGGKRGRKIIFNTHTGAVLMKKLSRQINDLRP